LKEYTIFLCRSWEKNCIHFYGIGIGRQKRTKFNELQKASKVAAAARFTPRKMSDRQLRAANLHFPHFQPVRSFLTQKKMLYIYFWEKTPKFGIQLEVELTVV